MKKLILSLLIGSIHLLSFSQNHKFEITFSPNLFGGLTPTTTKLTINDALTKENAYSICKDFTDKSKIDFTCIYNGCQNRAQIMSLYLSKKNIKHWKIWNFNPFVISLFNLANALEVNDKLNLLGNKLVWEFHVALAVPVKNSDNKIDTLIFDPAFSYIPLSASSWLDLQNSSTSYYTYTDPNWYNYVVLQPKTPWTGNCKNDTINFSDCFPYLITGDFYKYTITTDKTIAEEMAINEQITKATREIIYKIQVTDPLRSQLSSIVSNYNDFGQMLKGSIDVGKSSPFYKYIDEYKKSYKASLDYWTKELQNLH